MAGFVELHNKVTGAFFVLGIPHIIRIQPQEDRVDIFTVGGGYYTVSETYEQIKADIIATWRGENGTA